MTPNTDTTDTPDLVISVWMNDDDTIKMSIENVTGKVDGTGHPTRVEFLIPSLDALMNLGAAGPAGLGAAMQRGDLIPIALSEDEDEAWRRLL